MEKNILVVTSSPREGANTTLLADAFIEGAEAKGHHIRRFDVNKDKIEGCRACNKCWSSGEACIYQDGFNKFIGLLEAADVIVIASPVYWGAYPSTLKALIDKMYSFAVPWCEKDFSGKKSILLTCGDGADESAFVTLNTLHEGFVSYMKWISAGTIAVPQLVEAGAISKTDALEKARQMGKSL